jgi:hypothetical protein
LEFLLHQLSVFAKFQKNIAQTAGLLTHGLPFSSFPIKESLIGRGTGR